MRIGWRLSCLALVLLCGGAAASPAALDASAGPEVPAAHSALGDELVRSAPAGGVSQSAPAAASGAMDYPRVLGALAIVVALIFALRWCSRWVFPAAAGAGANRAVEILSRSPLSPKQQVMVIRVGRRLIVVGDTGSQMNPLCQITDPDEIAELVGQLRDSKSPGSARAFGAMFGLRKREFERATETDQTPQEPDEDRAGDSPPDASDAAADAAPLMSARQELSGLRERVRLLARQFNG